MCVFTNLPMYIYVFISSICSRSRDALVCFFLGREQNLNHFFQLFLWSCKLILTSLSALLELPTKQKIVDFHYRILCLYSCNFCQTSAAHMTATIRLEEWSSEVSRSWRIIDWFTKTVNIFILLCLHVANVGIWWRCRNELQRSYLCSRLIQDLWWNSW